MEEKLRGLVLNGIAYGENDKILTIYTLEKGIVSAGIKGVKKAGAKLKFASEPFCFAEFVFSVSGERRTVIGASLIDSFYSIREDIVKYYAGATVLEFIKKFLKQEIIGEDIFFLAIETLKTLSYGNRDVKSVVAEFLIKGLSIVGFGLNTTGCYKCACKEITGKVYFDCNSGGFLCEDCFDGKGREIKTSTFNAIKRLSLGLDDKENANFALLLLEYYITYRAEEKIKSLNELIKL